MQKPILLEPGNYPTFSAVLLVSTYVVIAAGFFGVYWLSPVVSVLALCVVLMIAWLYLPAL